MILGEMAIFLNFLSITTFSVLFLIAFMSFTITLKGVDLSLYSAFSRRSILWLIVSYPWIIGLLAATLSLLSGSQYLPIPSSLDIFHWHHPQEFIFNSWHGLTTLFAVSYSGYLIVLNVLHLIKNNRKVKSLHALAEPGNDGFYHLDTDTATAFTAGYSQPRCYITSALRHQLSRREFTIVQLHEKEHARQSDPLKKWFFQLLTSFYPSSISRQLIQSMTLAMEQCADAAVSRVITDKSFIAMTMLKVRRLTVRPFENNLEQSLVCHYAVDYIQLRIRYLLSDEKKKVFPFFAVILSAILMSIFSVFSIDLIHHFIEYRLSH